MTYLLDTNAISDLMRAEPRLEDWMAGLDRADRIVTCTIVRGEILFGISRLPEGKRRTELEQMGRQFLAAFLCEPVPERAGDIYAALHQPEKARDAWDKSLKVEPNDDIRKKQQKMDASPKE